MVSQLIYSHRTDRLELDGQELHCGDCLEVLIYDGLSRRMRWVPARIEYGDSWYLVGLESYQASGLFARIQAKAPETDLDVSAEQESEDLYDLLRSIGVPFLPDGTPLGIGDD